MDKYSAILKLRNEPLETENQAKNIILKLMSTDNDITGRNNDITGRDNDITGRNNDITGRNNIIPFVPLKYLLLFFRESKYTDFPKFLKERYSRCSKRYYFGDPIEKPNLKSRFLNRFKKKDSKFKFLRTKGSGQPMYRGSLMYPAMDVKSAKASEILLGRPSDYRLFTIMVNRPLTKSEYKNLVNKFPETSSFVEAATGNFYEKIFINHFVKKTNVYIPLPIAEFTADIYRI